MDDNGASACRRRPVAAWLERTGVEGGQHYSSPGARLADCAHAEAAALADDVLDRRIAGLGHDPAGNGGGLSRAEIGMGRHVAGAPASMRAAPDVTGEARFRARLAGIAH